MGGELRSRPKKVVEDERMTKRYNKRVIEPQGPPKVAKELADTRPLKEFVGWGPVKILPVLTPRGPRLQGYKCVASWAVVHSSQDEDEFQAAWERTGSDPVRLFHGTKSRNIAAITREGLQRGRKSCMFGSGIYFGQKEKASSFGHMASGACYLFEALVLLGKCLEAPKAFNYSLKYLEKRGYHSVQGLRRKTASWGTRCLLNDEWVVYSKDQVLLEYLHEYRALPREVLRLPHECQAIVKIRPPNIGNAHLREVLSEKQCKVPAYTALLVTGRMQVHLCKDCVTKLNLRIGER